MYIKPQMEMENPTILLEAGKDYIDIKENETFIQTFFSPKDEIDEIYFYLEKDSAKNASGTIDLKVGEGEEIYEEMKIDIGSNIENNVLCVKLEEGLTKFMNRECKLYISFSNVYDVKLLLSKDDNKDAHLIYNDGEREYDLAISTVNVLNKELLTIYIGIIMLLCIVGVVLTKILCIDNMLQWHQIYIPIALIFGLMYTLMLPPAATPDEFSHIQSAYKISNAILGIPNTNSRNTIYMRADDSKMAFNPEVSLDEYEKWGKGFFQTTTDETLIEQGVVLMDTAKIQYIVPSIGITAARLLHMNAAWTIYAGRLLNMCFFIIMVAMAIRIIPIGKEVILFITLNPVMLQSLISYSYDVFIYAILILYMALCLRYALCENVILTTYEEIVLYLLGLLVVVSKSSVYALFAFAFLLIPKEKFQIEKRFNYFRSIIVLLYLALMILLLLENLGGGYFITDQEMLSYSYLLKNPLKIIELGINTFLLTDPSRFWGYNFMVSRISKIIPATLLLSFILLFAVNDTTETVIDKKKKCWIGGVTALVFIEILAACVSWTPVNFPVLDGIWPRYFYILLLPTILFARSTRFLILVPKLKRYIVLMIVCLNVVASYSLYVGVFGNLQSYMVV